MTYVLSALAGLIVGGVVAWLLASTRATKSTAARVDEANRRAGVAENASSGMQGTIEELRRQVASAAADFETLRSKMESEHGARVRAETQASETLVRLEEEKKVIEDAKTKLSDAFKAIAGDTLNSSTSNFLKLAKEALDKVVAEAKGDLGVRQEAIQGLVKPLSESLKQFDEHVRAIEKSRQEGYAGLAERLKIVTETQQQLKAETANLVTALRRPEVRGRWGELTLRRVVELAGMSPHCDFCEQVSVETDEGRRRPDMVISMPSNRQIVVDSKVPIDAYLDAVKADSEEQRKAAMTRHAAQVRNHMDGLAAKAYWTQFENTPEYVVMFIAGESFFAAAVEMDQGLMEDALRKRVVMATPATLIALLHAVAHGWRQERVADNYRAITDLGRQLFERMSILTEHLAAVGKGLEKATEAYNKSVGSLETRVLASARKFKELGIGSEKDIPIVETVQLVPRLPAVALQGESELPAGNGTPTSPTEPAN